MRIKKIEKNNTQNFKAVEISILIESYDEYKDLM